MQKRDMSEEENMDVMEVVQPQETETVQESKEPVKGSAEYNFRETRKLIEQQSREIQELKQREYERMQAAQAPQAAQVDELGGLSYEDYTTRKHVEALAARVVEERLAQQEYATAEDRVRLKHKDYDDVVNDENIQKLINDSPRLANLLKSSDNPYLDAYEFIKQTSFYNEKNKKRAPGVDKVAVNSQKPVSVNAVQARPLTQANSYAFSSEEEKRAMYNEMMGYANRR